MLSRGDSGTDGVSAIAASALEAGWVEGAGLEKGVASEERSEELAGPAEGGKARPMSSTSSIVCCCLAARRALCVIAASARPHSDIHPVSPGGGAWVAEWLPGAGDSSGLLTRAGTVSRNCSSIANVIRWFGRRRLKAAESAMVADVLRDAGPGGTPEIHEGAWDERPTEAIRQPEFR